MSRPTDDVKNWMNMFRWIVKLIRDDYDVDEKRLVRTAVLETDCGLVIEQIETVLAIIAESFELHFPPGRGDEARGAVHAGSLDEGPVQAAGVHLRWI